MLDLDRFGAISGSWDRRLLNRILTRRSDEIASHDAYLISLEDPATYTSLKAAIERIFEGRVDDTLTPRFQFEHAASLIAEELGEPLETDLWTDAKEDFWTEVDAVVAAFRRAHAIATSVLWTPGELIERGPYLEVPIDAEMRVGSGYLTTDEVGRASAAVRHFVFTADVGQGLDWPDEAVDAAEEYSAWITEAARRGLGLFVHC